LLLSSDGLIFFAASSFCLFLCPLFSFSTCVCGFLTACQVVMTVPPFFGQAERRALQDAGQSRQVSRYSRQLCGPKCWFVAPNRRRGPPAHQH
jgi:hypothetical protein